MYLVVSTSHVQRIDESLPSTSLASRVQTSLRITPSYGQAFSAQPVPTVRTTTSHLSGLSQPGLPTATLSTSLPPSKQAQLASFVSSSSLQRPSLLQFSNHAPSALLPRSPPRQANGFPLASDLLSSSSSESLLQSGGQVWHIVNALVALCTRWRCYCLLVSVVCGMLQPIHCYHFGVSLSVLAHCTVLSTTLLQVMSMTQEPRGNACHNFYFPWKGRHKRNRKSTREDE